MSTDSRVKKRADAAGNVDKSRKRKVKLPVMKDKKHKKDKKHADECGGSGSMANTAVWPSFGTGSEWDSHQEPELQQWRERMRTQAYEEWMSELQQFDVELWYDSIADAAGNPAGESIAAVESIAADAAGESIAAVATKHWVERPLEPVVTNGRGMHIMGFAPPGGFRTTPIAAQSASSSNLHVAENVETAESVDKENFGAIRGPSKWKHGRPVFEHGNYSEYYGYRLAQPERTEDPRLTAIRKHFGDDAFLDKDVLDIGCNAGLVSLAVSRTFKARRVVGVDIDVNLIDAARKSLSGSADTGTVEFRAEDILQSPLRRPPDMQAEKFDAVLCFSVTKWVHFAHGDQGVQRLFKRIVKRLRPGGLLVLEPQEWSSYKKKRHLTREIRERVSNIQMPPEAFKAYLIGLGLETAGKIKPKGEVIKGFHRPMRLFSKAGCRRG